MTEHVFETFCQSHLLLGEGEDLSPPILGIATDEGSASWLMDIYLNR